MEILFSYFPTEADFNTKMKVPGTSQPIIATCKQVQG